MKNQRRQERPTGQRRQERSPGYTLAETLITLFLMAMVFGVVAVLITRGYRVLTFQSQKERTTLAAQVALDRMTAELREATAVDVVGPQLTFRKIDKSVAGRFDLTTPPTTYPLGDEIAVTYQTDGAGNLMRLVGGQSQLIVEGVTGFTCSLTGPRLDAALSVQEATRITRLSTVVFLPGLAP